MENKTFNKSQGSENMDNEDYDLLGKCRKILQDLLDEDSKYDNLMHEEEIDQVRLNILKDDLNAFSTINHNSAKNINSEKSSRIRQINSNNSPNINESAQNSQYSSQNGNEPIVKLKNLNNLNNDMFYLLDQNQQNLKRWNQDQMKQSKSQMEVYNDNYQIDKWEEAIKDSEQNEMDTLEFSIHREDDLNFNGQQSYNQSKIPQIRQIPQKEKRKGQPNQRNKKSARSQSIRKIQQLKTKYMNIKTILDQNDKSKKFEDLYQKNTQSSIRKQKDYQDQYESNADHLFTFKPQIDPVSNIIAQNSIHDESTLNKSSSSFQHSLYLKGLSLIEQKQKKIDKLKTIKERQLKQECTFQPNFHKNKGRNTQRFNYLTRDEERSIDNLYERGLKFVEDKRQRIVMEKKKLQNQSMIECSFKPKLQLTQNQSPVRKFRKTVKHIQKDKNFKLESSVLEERSVRQFLIRQEKAKELEEIKQKELNKVNGSKWKRGITKAKPFNIKQGVQSFFHKQLVADVIYKQQIENTKSRQSPQRSSKKVKTQNKSANKKEKSQAINNVDYKQALSSLHNALHSIDFSDTQNDDEEEILIESDENLFHQVQFS